MFEAAMADVHKEMERVTGMIRDPKSCQITFNEVVRPRESVLRFGEVRTICTADPMKLADELFGRYVRMEARPKDILHTAGTI
jgi:Protein of unknown function (DUF3037)